ncbi:MAG: hypothetical protein JWM44_2195 [Bacilli bacterium]|nr:hypothetical protein [Bacilli bacterium]
MKVKAMVRLVSYSFILCLLVTAWEMTSRAEAAASDIKGHWAEGQINVWIDKGFISGYEDDSFRPDHTISRAEFIALINRSFEFNEWAEVTFTDVPAKNWAYTEVAKAVKAGYIQGYDKDTFGANNPISREEVAVIVHRLLRLVPPVNQTIVSFNDANLIAPWGKEAVDAMIAGGIMRGYTQDNTFRPGNSITRAEAVVTLDRAIKAEVYAFSTESPFI